MKKLLWTVLMLFFLICITAIAHPPSEVVAEYDLKSNILSVNVTHNVGGDPVHFIENIAISHNGKEIIVQKISKQLGDSQTFVYFIPGVEVGDEIEIVAVCNIFGEKVYKFNVKENE